MGRFGFLAACLVAFIAGAVFFFVGAVIVVSPLTSNPDTRAGLALLSAFIGAIAAVLLLVWQRNSGPTLGSRFSAKFSFAPGATDPTEPQVAPLNQAGEWHYAKEGKRKGPISADAISALLRTGKLAADDTVWKKGMKEWLPVKDSIFGPEVISDGPPPLAAQKVSNGYAWALALAPLWATLIHYTLAYAYLAAKYGPVYHFVAPLQIEGIVAKTWWFVWGVNTAMAALDDYMLKAAGWSSDRLKTWMTVIVPVYLYRRDQLLGAGVTRLLVWCGCLVVSFLPIW